MLLNNLRSILLNEKSLIIAVCLICHGLTLFNDGRFFSDWELPLIHPLLFQFIKLLSIAFSGILALEILKKLKLSYFLRSLLAILFVSYPGAIAQTSISSTFNSLGIGLLLLGLLFITISINKKRWPFLSIGAALCLPFFYILFSGNYEGATVLDHLALPVILTKEITSSLFVIFFILSSVIVSQLKMEKRQVILDNFIKVCLSLLISLFIFKSMKNSLEYQRDWFRQLALVETFKKDPVFKTEKVFSFSDPSRRIKGPTPDNYQCLIAYAHSQTLKGCTQAKGVATHKVEISQGSFDVELFSLRMTKMILARWLFKGAFNAKNNAIVSVKVTPLTN